VRKSGERFWARVVLTGLHDSQGHLRGFAKVTQDLTERRHLQDLEKATRNTHEFIAMLAHELRNPLAPIRNAVEVMARVPPHDPAHQAMRQTIERQSAQLKRIVDDLLDIARITRGSITLERTRVGLAEVVQRALEMSAPVIDAARHAVSVDLPPEPLVVEGDAARLIQLLGNLLNNAARYTPQRGSIAVKVAAEGGDAVVRVRDTGRGIDPRLASRIFDMFVQGRSPLERVGGGLGVGLALARRIAELHGGTLEAASEGEDRGSEFTLRLPLAQGGPAPAERRAKPPALVAARRILVVDDNVDAAETLELLLGSLGHETAVAHDGVQALKLAVEFRPDLVLLDIGMPGMDGYEVARRLRALRSKAPLRIVAVTGWGQESDRQRSREAGFDLHLVKPVDAASLARALDDENGKNAPTVH
jgi:signal transduction histidine kinase/ActR/RegA family two-component response regulator